MKYKFEQFKVEIDKQLSVDVVLICESGRFGVTAENMPYVDSWSDEDVEVMVNEWLKQFEA